LGGDQAEQADQHEDGGVQGDQALGGGPGPPDRHHRHAEQHRQPGDPGEEHRVVAHGNTRRW
jgi:hypothetical protein